MLVNIGSDDPTLLAVLSSRVHSLWTLATGGTLEDRPRYTKTRTFDPFPFPTMDEARRCALGGLGEELDAFRKDRIATRSFLTMTGLYNVLERIRELEASAPVPQLSDAERDIYEAGCVAVLNDLHNRIDDIVLQAYGWDDLSPALVGRPGGTTPSPHKSAEQEDAEEELLSRLVALNRERAAEEARGQIRWLRPEFQIPKLAARAPKPEAEEQIEAELSMHEPAGTLKWPADGLEQIAVVRDLLAKAASPTLPADIAAAFDGRNTAKRKDRVARVLDTLAATGAARKQVESGAARYFLAR